MRRAIDVAAAVHGRREAVTDQPVVGVEPDDGELVESEVVRGVADRLAQRVAERECLDRR